MGQELTEFCKIKDKRSNKYFSGSRGRNLWRFKHHAEEAFRNREGYELKESNDFELEYFVLVPYKQYYDMVEL